MQLPSTITSKITAFAGIQLKLYALHFVGTVQIAIWAAGPLSGYGASFNTSRSPTAHFPHLRFSFHRSDTRREQTSLPPPAIIDGEI
jgi:hypothetical protein